MIDEVKRHGADWTEAPVIERGFSIALNLDQATVSHMQQYATTAVATAAHAFQHRRIRTLRVNSLERNIHNSSSRDMFSVRWLSRGQHMLSA